VCIIDTENGRADYYAHLGEYSVIPITGTYETEKYINAITDAESAGFEVIIIDSLTHAWNGPGGILQLVDSLAATSRLNNFTAWGVATPKEQALRQRIMSSTAHTIVTIRSKMETTIIDGKPKKIGMKPEYRDGIEYEFTIYGEMNERQVTIIKDNTGSFSAPVFTPTTDTGRKIADWCNTGAKPAPEIVTEVEVRQTSAISSYLNGMELIYCHFGQREFWMANRNKIFSLPAERLEAGYNDAVRKACEYINGLQMPERLKLFHSLPDQLKHLEWVQKAIKQSHE
jgi:hypothetical protein